MSSTRAAAVLVIATTLYGVTFAVDQWALLIAVFLLTLAALYGLGMMLASLFLMWGREAWHLTQLLVEPVYFVSGLNFPVGRLGVLGSLAIRSCRWRSASTRCASSRSPSAAYPIGTPSPAVEAADPRGDGRRLPRPVALDARGPRADGPGRGPPLGALAVSGRGGCGRRGVTP